MKRTLKSFFSFLLVMGLAASLTVTAFAAESSLTYKGRNKAEFAPGNGYTGTDLFDEFKGVMPGDTLTERITVKNEAADSDYIKVYLQAMAHPNDDEGHAGEEMSAEVLEKETVVSMQDFLAQLSLKVKKGEKVIYAASPDELAGLAEPVLIADRLKKGDSVALEVNLYVPIELGNEYANRVGEVDWKFIIESYEETSGGGKDGDDPPPTIVIPDSPVPGDGGFTEENPEENPDEIPDEEPPLAVLPQTGLLQWPIPVMAAAGLLLVMLGMLSERKRKVQNEYEE